jgi:hypothetical protein
MNCQHENQGRCACHDGQLERDVIAYMGHRVVPWLCVIGIVGICWAIAAGAI